MRMRHIVDCGLSRSAEISLHYPTNGMIFAREKIVAEQEVRVLIHSTTFV